MPTVRWLSVVLALLLAYSAANAQQVVGTVPTYTVLEIAFTGPTIGLGDAPARDVEFWARFRHESGSPTFQIHGFWDGGASFKIRFTPTRPGHWTLVEVHSNRDELRRQHEGAAVLATTSERHGFWEVDAESPGRRWYRRSDGSHQYIDDVG